LYLPAGLERDEMLSSITGVMGYVRRSNAALAEPTRVRHLSDVESCECEGGCSTKNRETYYPQGSVLTASVPKMNANSTAKCTEIGPEITRVAA